MKLIEILLGLKNGIFQKGEEIKSDEGFWFKITHDDLLLGEVDGEVFEIGKLLTAPLPAGSDKP
jgi:hypothetical protein